MKLDPWSSEEIQDIEVLCKEFGLKKFTDDLKLDYHLFKRNYVIAHRDFEKIFERIKQKKPFINMTGIASSGKLHFGHKVDIDLFVFFKSLGAKNYFCVSDIDAYCSRPDKTVPSLKVAKEFAIENLAHVLALGLDKKDVYVQSQKEPRYYEFTFELSKKITRNTFEAVYGHIDLGKVSAALLQYADILHPQLKEWNGIMPSITGIGLEQDPHARLTRDIARRLPYELKLPSFIYFKHQSGLLEGKKMSSSEPNTAIFLSDSIPEMKKKIEKAVTGGRETIELQKKLGGKPEVCKVFEFQSFHNLNDKEVESIFKKCKAGELMCGDCKKLLIVFLEKFLEKHHKKVEKTRAIAEKIIYGK